MKIETILKNTNYHLPKEWNEFNQRALKEDMLRHIHTNGTEKKKHIFIEKMATYSDMQFGNLCVRLNK